jgi:hypothetical protein
LVAAIYVVSYLAFSIPAIIASIAVDLCARAGRLIALQPFPLPWPRKSLQRLTALVLALQLYWGL